MRLFPGSRAIAALITLSFAAGGVALAAPASALSPCISNPEPPAYCGPSDPPSYAPIPAAPTGLVVRLLTPTSVTLRWQDNSTNETYFRVTRYVQGSTTGGVAFTAPARSGAGGIRAYTDTTAAAGGFYRYTVQAVDAPAGEIPGISQGQSLIVNMPTGLTSVDLSTLMPSIGNQGPVNSCSAWAADYYLRGWYAQRDGYYPTGPDGNGGFEPMYTYSQYVHAQPGHNGGTTIYGNLTIQLASGANGIAGLDTRADYAQGDFDSADLPTAAEAANGAKYRIASINQYAGGANLGAQIKASIDNGQPLAISATIFDGFMSLSPTNYFVQPPPDGTTVYNIHSVFAYKYDSKGVWIANQWGTGWGLNGTAELSWAYVNSDVDAAYGIVPVTPAGM